MREKVLNQLRFKGAYHYSQGGKPGKLLASLVKGKDSKKMVVEIKNQEGSMVRDLEGITEVFAGFYKELYRSRWQEGLDLDDYFSILEMPKLLEEQKQWLDRPIEIEELQETLRGMPLGKTPGPDGLPSEVLKVTGVALICLGASVQMKLSDISVVVAETSSGAPMVLTVMGMVIFFLSGFGAVAAIKENSILIKSFTVIMLLVFIIEIIVGMSAYYHRDELQRLVVNRFLNMLNKYGKDRQITRGVDGVQQEFKCCGAKNFTDWFNISVEILENSVPNSCCRMVQQKCGEDALEHSERLYQGGCVLKMNTWISEHFDVIGALGIGLGFTQILGILFSCCLVRTLQKNYVSM
ncbi:CD63 antigen-like [Dendropsophus ebraccatus]|uniref:CD63 antigen-like n=1 Tax=Dendropsophus ebraccatus TaxID=150705 RepID=UPI003831B66C